MKPGDIIADRYRLDALIDEGGMATVWRATHVDLAHAVAVKFNTVRGPGADEAADRFLREARVAASVRHRNIVDVIDFGLTEDGVPYIVMEFLAGVNLGDRLSVAPPMPMPMFGQVLSSSLSGLAAVHDAGIVHRDIKPENIYLLTDADGTFPKILDFGISRTTDAAPTLRSSVPTVEGLLLGTPEYMSAEQARGLKDIDARTDLYSMGVVAYEALTGHLPFETEHIGDLLIQITTGVARPVSSYRPDLGQPLSDWVERAMSRQREARFPDAREMRQALLDALQTTARVATNWSSATLALPGAPPIPPSAEIRAARKSSQFTLGAEDVVPALPQQTNQDSIPGLARHRRGLWVVAISATVAAMVGVGLAARPGDAASRGEPGDRTEQETTHRAASTEEPAPRPPPASSALQVTPAIDASVPQVAEHAAVAEPAPDASTAIPSGRPAAGRRPRKNHGRWTRTAMGARMRSMTHMSAAVPFSDPGF